MSIFHFHVVPFVVAAAAVTVIVVVVVDVVVVAAAAAAAAVAPGDGVAALGVQRSDGAWTITFVAVWFLMAWIEWCHAGGYWEGMMGDQTTSKAKK